MSLTYIALLQISASIGQRIEFTLYRFTLEETKKKTTNREDSFPCDNNIIIKDGSKHHMVSFLKREKRADYGAVLPSAWNGVICS